MYMFERRCSAEKRANASETPTAVRTFQASKTCSCRQTPGRGDPAEECCMGEVQVIHGILHDFAACQTGVDLARRRDHPWSTQVLVQPRRLHGC